MDSLIGPKPAQEILALFQHLFPAVSVSVPKRRRLEIRPLERKELNRLHPEEVSFHRLLEDPAEDQAGLILPLTPAVHIAVLVLQRALQVMRDLRIAVMVLHPSSDLPLF